MRLLPAFRISVLFVLPVLVLAAAPIRAQVPLGDTGLVNHVAYPSTGAPGTTVVVELAHQSNPRFVYRTLGDELFAYYAPVTFDTVRDTAILVINSFYNGLPQRAFGTSLVTQAFGIRDTLAVIRPGSVKSGGWAIDLTYDATDSLWHAASSPRLVNSRPDSTIYTSWALRSTDVTTHLTVRPHATSTLDSARITTSGDSVIVAPNRRPLVTLEVTSPSGYLGHSRTVSATLDAHVVSGSGVNTRDSLWHIPVSLVYGPGPLGPPITCDSSRCTLLTTTNVGTSATLMFTLGPTLSGLATTPPTGLPWQMETLDSTRDRLVVRITLLPTTCGTYRDTLSMEAIWTDFKGDRHSGFFRYGLNAFVSNDGEPNYWEPVHAPLPLRVDGIECDPSGNLITLGTGCWISSDRGASWRDTHQAISSLGIARTGELLAVSGNNLNYSSDMGSSWHVIHSEFTGFADRNSIETSFHISDPSYVPVSCALLSRDTIEVYGTATGETIAGGVRQRFTFARRFQSTDRGVSWTSPEAKLIGQTVGPWEHILRDSGDRLVSWSTYDGTTAMAIGPHNNWIYSFGRRSFYRVGAGGYTISQISVNHHGDVFAIGDTAGVFHLAPGDSVYRGMNVGLPTRNVTAIATAPDGTTYAYIPEFGLYRSTPSAMSVHERPLSTPAQRRVISHGTTSLCLAVGCDVRSCTIHDMQGACVASQVVCRGADLQLATASLPAGLYFLSLESDCGRESVELLVIP